MDFDSHILQSVDILACVGRAASSAAVAAISLGARPRKPTTGVVQDFVLVERGRRGCRAGIFRRFFINTIMLSPLPALRAAAPPLSEAAGVGGVVVRRASFLRRAVVASGARVHRVELFGTFVKLGIFAVGIPAARGGFPE